MKKQSAVKYYKTKAEVAKVLNITRQAVNNWGPVVPIKQAFRLNELSDGRIPMRMSDYK